MRSCYGVPAHVSRSLNSWLCWLSFRLQILLTYIRFHICHTSRFYSGINITRKKRGNWKMHQPCLHILNLHTLHCEFFLAEKQTNVCPEQTSGTMHDASAAAQTGGDGDGGCNYRVKSDESNKRCGLSCTLAFGWLQPDAALLAVCQCRWGHVDPQSCSSLLADTRQQRRCCAAVFLHKATVVGGVRSTYSNGWKKNWRYVTEPDSSGEETWMVQQRSSWDDVRSAEAKTAWFNTKLIKCNFSLSDAWTAERDCINVRI